MLVLSRKKNEKIVINESIVITIVATVCGLELTPLATFLSIARKSTRRSRRL
jgi:hypothetical protein